MPLSFVGSFKCYIFVKFVTLILYQCLCVMSTDFIVFSYKYLDIINDNTAFFSTLRPNLLIIL